MKPKVKLLLSIDTEEDNWRPTREGIRVENIRALPAMHDFLVGLELRPTYFVNYAVTQEPFAVAILRSIHEGGQGEIGGHLHPWHTPPMDEPLGAENTMMKNLPAELQAAKLRTLREALTEVVGARPTSFRAGRFGLGPAGARALIAEGFEVDSSVTPYVNWREHDNGADFSHAPLACYRVGGHEPLDRPDASGALCEVPISCGFTRRPFAWRRTAHRFLSQPALRRLGLLGIASRSGLVRRVIGSPETDSLQDLLALAHCLTNSGAEMIQLFFHSPSLVPGLSPFVQSTSDLDRLRNTLRGFVEGLGEFAEVTPLTVTEAGRTLCGRRSRAA